MAPQQVIVPRVRLQFGEQTFEIGAVPLEPRLEFSNRQSSLQQRRCSKQLRIGAFQSALSVRGKRGDPALPEDGVQQVERLARE
jgi:hypothetical protein